MALIDRLGGHPSSGGALPARDPVEVRQRVREYIDGGYEIRGDIIPSLAGACVMLKTSKQMMWEWSQNDQLLTYLLDELRVLQEQCLIRGAITGSFNSTIAKLIMATHHGYSDRVDTTSLTITAEISDAEAVRRISYAMQSITPVPMPELRSPLPPTALGLITTDIVPTQLFANTPTDTKD